MMIATSRLPRSRTSHRRRFSDCWKERSMPPKRKTPFNAQRFLDSAGLAKKVVRYAAGQVIFTQGDPCDHVLYIRHGNIKLSVLSKAGKEAVVAMLSAGEFFGEG